LKKNPIQEPELDDEDGLKKLVLPNMLRGLPTGERIAEYVFTVIILRAE
jgi:hypothetical protein